MIKINRRSALTAALSATAFQYCTLSSKEASAQLHTEFLQSVVQETLYNLISHNVPFYFRGISLVHATYVLRKLTAPEERRSSFDDDNEMYIRDLLGRNREEAEYKLDKLASYVQEDEEHLYNTLIGSAEPSFDRYRSWCDSLGIDHKGNLSREILHGQAILAIAPAAFDVDLDKAKPESWGFPFSFILG